MKIYPNSAKTAPLLELIDDYADGYENASAAGREGDWRIRLHMAEALGVEEETIVGKDVKYFIRRMGGAYLARRVRGIGSITAQRLCRWAEAQE